MEIWNAFIKFANEFGLPWAFVVAEGVIIWRLFQHLNKNTVPRDVLAIFEKQTTQQFSAITEGLNEVVKTVAGVVNTLERVSLLVSLSRHGGEGNE
jgi:hypothetical protein